MQHYSSCFYFYSLLCNLPINDFAPDNNLARCARSTVIRSRVVFNSVSSSSAFILHLHQPGAFSCCLYAHFSAQKPWQALSSVHTPSWCLCLSGGVVRGTVSLWLSGAQYFWDSCEEGMERAETFLSESTYGTSFQEQLVCLWKGPKGTKRLLFSKHS